jgi:biotin carboxyl carrier protein
MKMENMIIAPVAGTVAAVSVNPGDAVTQGQELLVIG